MSTPNLIPVDWSDSCDWCDYQEGRHYCLLHGITIKNMDTVRCADWAEKIEPPSSIVVPGSARPPLYWKTLPERRRAGERLEKVWHFCFGAMIGLLFALLMLAALNHFRVKYFWKVFGEAPKTTREARVLHEAKFGNISLSMKKSHLKLIKKWEVAAGFEAFGKETVTDRKTLRECLHLNQRWLEDHLTEIARRASAVACI